MKIPRRRFLSSSAALLTAPVAAPAAPARTVTEARRDFPWAEREVYLNCALEHPLSVQTEQALREYVGYLTHGPDSGRASIENGKFQEEVRANFARLIHAEADEIAFVPSTQIGENIVLDGLDIAASGGNVVTNDLHYGGSLFNYRQRQKQGLDVRIVPPRDGRQDLGDLERALDKKTRLVALALVSNVNGHLHDIRAISSLAHSYGAYVYTDVIQAAGAVPIDVRAMGIDFLACSAYKWLMGGRFGYLYARRELQGAVLAPRRFGGKGGDENSARRYEISTACHLGFVNQHVAVPYILGLGVENIRNHVRPLTERLQQEMPGLGYPTLTPPGSESPIATYEVKDAADAQRRLERAGVFVTLRPGRPVGQMRVSPSVFNNMADIERLLEALS
jgi:selenocysteine lyase/cysteine desulfurase